MKGRGTHDPTMRDDGSANVHRRACTALDVGNTVASTACHIRCCGDDGGQNSSEIAGPCAGRSTVEALTRVGQICIDRARWWIDAGPTGSLQHQPQHTVREFDGHEEAQHRSHNGRRRPSPCASWRAEEDSRSAVAMILGAVETVPPCAHGADRDTRIAFFLQTSPVCCCRGDNEQTAERQGEEQRVRPQPGHTLAIETQELPAACDGPTVSTYHRFHAPRHRGRVSSRKLRLPSAMLLVGLICVQIFLMVSLVTAFQTPTTVIVAKSPQNGPARQVFGTQPQVL